MDAHVRETYADAPRVDRDASGDDDASTAGDDGAIRLECGLFRIVETLGVDARARRVSRVRDDRRVDRSFSISAMFGLTSESGGGDERERAGDDGRGDDDDDGIPRGVVRERDVRERGWER